ncbi:uncharacterized protein [Solanum lycopersicum]|uniref:uncharacterized protein n=1 Tax=Solanum lycopersicum TaxID=4081 RepID=UPI003747DB10
MHDFLMAEDSELWNIFLDGPFISVIEEKDREKTRLVPKPRQKYDEADRKKIEKGYKAKTLLVYGIGPDKFNCVSACESAKEIWDCLKIAHEGTEQIKESKIDMDLATWGDSSSDSEDPDEPNDMSMMVVHEEEPYSMKCMLSWLIQKMKKRMTSFTKNKIKYEEKMSKMKDKMVSLESDNIELKKQLTQINEEAEKLNGRTNGLQVSERSSSQCWYMDSGCSKHMTGDIKNFLSLKTLQGGGVSFSDGKKGYILGVVKVGKYLEESIDNVYHVQSRNGKKYILVTVDESLKMFVLNNGKDDLGKSDLRSDEGVFVGYSSSSKAYRIFNKITQCIEESIHVVFDEDENLKSNGSNDEDEVIKLFNSQKIEGSEALSQSTSKSPENDAIIEEEEHVDQLNQSALRPGWKHSSSHPLDNLIYPLNFGIHTRSKTRNLVAFSAFISSIEPKNVKEALGDAD